jgi:rhodanese-related sulfurtransferase
LEELAEQLHAIPKNLYVIVLDENGKKGHQALRMLKGAGIENVWNISGGNISMQRYARAVGFETIQLQLLPLEEKKIGAVKDEEEVVEKETEKAVETDTPLVVDVRTTGEFRGGAYPGAINIPLDELQMRLLELGSKDRDITVYCASGARSAYAQRMLMQLGYTKVVNGGGLMQMMRKR